jgi:hypothetical protein
MGRYRLYQVTHSVVEFLAAVPFWTGRRFMFTT